MQTKFEQLLDYLVNEETEKAEELFHEIVVEKSRTIYENLIAEEEKGEDDDEHKDKKHAQDEKVDEMFDDVEEESVLEIGGDPADELINDVEFGDEEGGEEGDEGGFEMSDEEDHEDEQDERIDDLADALADLKAEFEKILSGGDMEKEPEGEEGEEDEDEEEVKEDEEDFLREYVDKVTDGHGAEKKGAAEKADNTKSPVAGENRLGGQGMKFGQGDEKGGVKGGLLNPSPKDMNTGNVNVKGGTNAKQFYSKDSKGHGAEKAGSGESAGNTKSPVAPSHAK